MKKKGVLLINLGTPKSPSVKDVGIYLFEILNDPRVIDIPWFF
jgi:ferrochelatase